MHLALLCAVVVSLLAVSIVHSAPLQRWLPLGTFEVVSGKLEIAEADFANESSVHAAQTGKWVAAITLSDEGELGERVSELRVLHEGTKPEALKWTLSDFKVSTDFAVAGFFDALHFGDDSVVPKTVVMPNDAEPGDAWREAFVSRMTEDAHVIPFGVVSTSGFGDGSYRVILAKGTDGKLIGARILFIGDDAEGDRIRAKAHEDFSRHR